MRPYIGAKKGPNLSTAQRHFKSQQPLGLARLHPGLEQVHQLTLLLRVGAAPCGARELGEAFFRRIRSVKLRVFRIEPSPAGNGRAVLGAAAARLLLVHDPEIGR